MINLMVCTSEPLNGLALELLFRFCEDISLLPVACDVASVVREVASSRPDVLLLTIDMRVDWGVLDMVRRHSPGTRVVLWTHEIAPELAFQSIERGVRGILRKSLAPDMILKCVRKVHEGELWFEKDLTQTFLSGRAIKVSNREDQLIQLVSQGLKNKEIASVMSITEGTVKVYASRLFEKLGVKDRLELALFGLRNAQSYAEPVSGPCPGKHFRQFRRSGRGTRGKRAENAGTVLFRAERTVA